MSETDVKPANDSPDQEDNQQETPQTEPSQSNTDKSSDDDEDRSKQDHDTKEKDSGAVDNSSNSRKAREKTYMPDKDDTQRECACSDQDFIRLMASDSSILCKTVNRWQQSYQLDVNDLKEKALRLIKGDFRDLYGDLDAEEQEKIEREIARLQRERTELLMGAIGRLAKENTLS